MHYEQGTVARTNLISFPAAWYVDLSVDGDYANVIFVLMSMSGVLAVPLYMIDCGIKGTAW